MAEPVSSTLFLATGLPKSGTTFLQRLLGLHPQISCPSEQVFDVWHQILGEALRHYAGILQTMDRRTGGQGASPYGATIENDMLVATLSTLAKSFARGRPIHGLNDNTVFGRPQRYDNLFGHPKIVGILRNPVDVALSGWRHNRRLAREEPANARNHLALLDNPKGTVEGYIERMVRGYNKTVEAFLVYAGGRPNFHIVRYEALVDDKPAEVKRLLSFLGADASDGAVSAIVAASSREAMAATSKNPAFFGLDAKDTDRVNVSPAFRRAILESAITPRMRAIGYDVAALMAGHE